MSQATRLCPNCNTPLPGVASFCYVCGSATPTGIDLATGSRLAVTPSEISKADLHNRVQRVLGPGYELGKRIGAGGFAEVLKARDLRLKRDIAVKVLRPDLGLTPGVLDRFRREAEVVAALRHPNIVPIYDIGEGDGVAFIVMPFIEGESLRSKMEREGAMPPEEVRRILREAASGLAAAHEAGVVHRDIKPENIMLEGRESRVLLMDFGIAKAMGGEEDTPLTEEGVAPALTSTGIIVGTPHYMSPEQACGDKSIDARTDQYSLAVVGYRMLAGSLPFDGDSTRSVLYQQLVAEPTPVAERVSGVPAGLAAAISKAMQKEPRDRFGSMTEFAEAMAVGAIPAKRPVTAKPKKQKKQKKPRKPFKFPIIKLPSLKLPQAKLPTMPRVGSAAGARSWLGVRRHQAYVGGGVATLVVAALAIWGMNGSGGILRGADFEPTSLFGTAADSAFEDSLAALAGVDSLSSAAGTTNGTESAAAAAAKPTAESNKNRGRTPERNKQPAASNRSSKKTDTTAAAAPADSGCAMLAGVKDWTRATGACTAAAQAGNVTAMRVLAGMYDKGEGVTEDPVQAFTWYKRAAPRDAAARFELARMYEIGRGTTKDLQANITNLRGAATMGNRQAILTLASRLETGAGMDRDYKEAATWYQKGAAEGSVMAMLKLAHWSEDGRGVKKDKSTAIGWYAKAAAAGSSEGAWRAGKAYLDGDGVAKDTTRGLTLIRQAARLGNPDAVSELDKRAKQE